MTAFVALTETDKHGAEEAVQKEKVIFPLLAPLTPLTRSAALRFAMLASLANSVHRLTHFAHSLVGRLKFLNMCSRCKRVQREETRFWSSLETRPNSFTLEWIDHTDTEIVHAGIDC